MAAAAIRPGTATSAFFARPRFVNSERALANSSAVQSQDGSLRGFRGGHGNESKAAGTPGLAIEWHFHLDDSAVCGEQILEVSFTGGIGKIAYVQF